MNTYTINRGGRILGPYTLQEVQRYLMEGRLGRNEAACLNGDQHWVPLRQLTETGGSEPPVDATGGSGGKVEKVNSDPPSLHWGLLLLLSFVSAGIASIIWGFVQAAWVRKLDRQSRAGMLLGFSAACLAGATLFYAGLEDDLKAGRAIDSDQAFALGLASMCMIGWGVLTVVALFSMRSSMEWYYREVEPLGFSLQGQPYGLRLSGVMTFFFNVYYLQFHMSRIARWKATGVLD